MNKKDKNIGKWNSGDGNIGDENSGHYNIGRGNSGNRNVGDRNSGLMNSGDSNSGNGNCGTSNYGNYNAGSWNSGNYNSGFLNTDTSKVKIFNKETELKEDDINFPFYFYMMCLTKWIDKYRMTDEEKKEHPNYKKTRGYLKTITYKEAWRIAWDGATDKDRRKTLELPNWDNELFLEITEIDVEKELRVEEENKRLEKENQELLDKYIKILGKYALTPTRENIIKELRKENEELKERIETDSVMQREPRYLVHGMDVTGSDLLERYLGLERETQGWLNQYNKLLEDHEKLIGHPKQTPLEWLKEMAEKYPGFKKHLIEGISGENNMDWIEIILDTLKGSYDVGCEDLEDFFGGKELIRWLDKLGKEDKKEEEL